jgi:hypothetical protein
MSPIRAKSRRSALSITCDMIGSSEPVATLDRSAFDDLWPPCLQLRALIHSNISRNASHLTALMGVRLTPPAKARTAREKRPLRQRPLFSIQIQRN